MVKIIGYNKRFSEKKNKEFLTLTVQGDLEIIKSATGGSYISAPSVSIPSTFDEDTCKGLIGKELSGAIKKVSCKPYSYKIESTGKEITLDYKFEYIAEGASQKVESKRPEMILPPGLKQLNNGQLAQA